MPRDFSPYLLDELDTDYPTKHNALVEELEDSFNNALAANAVTTAIDWTASDYHTKAMSANTTFTFSNVPAGISSILMRLTVTLSAVPTWPAAVIWEEGVTPTFTSGKTHMICFITEDGGTTVRGIARLNFAS
jgi:hypothetical protein